jgi:hypothetical protein
MKYYHLIVLITSLFWFVFYVLLFGYLFDHKTYCYLHHIDTFQNEQDEKRPLENAFKKMKRQMNQDTQGNNE